MTDLIKVTQLPIIEERLLAAKEYVDKTVEGALALVCTEETIQSVKTTRSELNKQFNELEEQRKAVKNAVLDPYNRFEEVYRRCVSDAFKRADTELKEKIISVEADMKRRCEAGLREYFLELCEAHHINFVPFERTGIVISLTDARAKIQPPKKLRDQLDTFIHGVEADIEMISAMDDAAEIMAEYKPCLNPIAAINTVRERHRRIEAEQEAKAAREEVKTREDEAVKKVEAFAPPEVKEPKYRCKFTVTATKPQLKRLKEFMTMEGIKYE